MSPTYLVIRLGPVDDEPPEMVARTLMAVMAAVAPGDLPIVTWVDVDEGEELLRIDEGQGGPNT